jgi:FkbM family methyltransferase
MKALLRKGFEKFLPRQLASIREIRANRIHRRGNLSFGQEGEDRVISSLMYKVYGGSYPGTGFYVDVGAHDPFRFSNTYMFYKMGWSGINIDAAPGSMRSFTTHRPRDLNLEVGIGKEISTATFYLFNEPALNTFDRDLALARCVPPYRQVGETTVAIVPLRDVFSKHLAANRPIDFLTVDVEGRDIDVLQSNDWLNYRPKIVLVEILHKTVVDAAIDPVALYLAGLDYAFYSKTVNTALFIDATLPTFRMGG